MQKTNIGEAFERALQARTLCEAFQITAAAGPSRWPCALLMPVFR